MADFVFNVAKGKVNEYHDRVDGNDPSASELVLLVLSVTGDQDAAMIDVDTVAALLALSNVAEVTNTNYARIDLNDTEISASTVDDTNNRREADLPDQTWSAIAAGDAWTDLVVAYDPTGSSADSALIPLTLHDFAATPDGNDITAQFNAAGYFRGA